MDVARHCHCFVFIWEDKGSNLRLVLAILKCFVAPPLRKLVFVLRL